MNKITCVQPALPNYRLDFFEESSRLLDGKLTVYYSPTDMHGIEVKEGSQPAWARSIGQLTTVLPGVEWQKGAISVPIQAGDTVVVTGAPRCISTIALLIKARYRGASTVWWGHYWSSTSKPWRYAIRLALMRLSHAVVFYTDQEVKECQLRMGRFAPKQLYALNNGINVDPISHLRTPYNASARKLRILFIGRLTEKAQVHLLLAALQNKHLTDIQLEVIGNGPEETQLRELAQQIGVNQRIQWHGSLTDESAIAAIANNCILFVYPGSIGLSLIHALAYGLPAIVHSNRWHHMPEIAALSQGINGLTFDEGNSASLADTIADALSDTNRLNEMSKQSINTTRNNFNTKTMAKRFTTAIRELQNR